MSDIKEFFDTDQIHEEWIKCVGYIVDCFSFWKDE